MSDASTLDDFYLETIKDDQWFMEMIGHDGFNYHPNSPSIDPLLMLGLRTAYIANDGVNFLSIIKSYAEPGLLFIAQQELDELYAKQALYEKECIDTHADMQRDIWLEEQLIDKK